MFTEIQTIKTYFPEVFPLDPIELNKFLCKSLLIDNYKYNNEKIIALSMPNFLFIDNEFGVDATPNTYCLFVTSHKKLSFNVKYINLQCSDSTNNMSVIFFDNRFEIINFTRKFFGKKLNISKEIVN